MKPLPVLVTVGLVACALAISLFAQQGSPANTSPRYDAQIVSGDGDPPVFLIVNHQTNTAHIYMERDDSYLEHQGAVDLTKAGKIRIDYLKATD